MGSRGHGRLQEVRGHWAPASHHVLPVPRTASRTLETATDAPSRGHAQPRTGRGGLAGKEGQAGAPACAGARDVGSPVRPEPPCAPLEQRRPGGRASPGPTQEGHSEQVARSPAPGTQCWGVTRCRKPGTKKSPGDTAPGAAGLDCVLQPHTTLSLLCHLDKGPSLSGLLLPRRPWRTVPGAGSQAQPCLQRPGQATKAGSRAVLARPQPWPPPLH